MPTVTVNLNVNVDASGDIQVFGSDKDGYANKIIAIETLPVNALYDEALNTTDNKGAGLIEFWEPSSDLGNIHVKLANSSDFNINNIASYEGTAKVLARGLQKVLVDKLDCTAASPFNDDTKYGGLNADYYRKIDGFGRVALGAYAHYLFGHIAATAAITNDETFMASMLSLNSTNGVKDGGQAGDRYNDWDKKSDVDTKLVANWNGSQSAEDANLAVALVKAIIDKGIGAANKVTTATRDTTTRQASSSTVGFGTDTLANIVAQVIGQDASRAMGQDNNALDPEVHQVLRFYPGDKIVVSITLNGPNVTVLSGQQATPAIASGVDKNLTKDGIQAETYAIEITLGPRDVPIALENITSTFNDIITTDIETVISNLQSVTIDNSTPISLSTLGFDTTSIITDSDNKVVREAIIESIFEIRPDITSFIINRDDIGLTNTETANTTLLVIKPVTSITTTPIVIDSSLNSTTSVYASLTNVGDINRFSVNSNTFTVIKTGSNTFSFTDESNVTSIYNTGDIITYQNVSIEFGSVVISQAKAFAPTSLIATPGDGQVSISFIPGSDNGNVITNYKYSINGGAYIAFNPAVTSSPVLITGLTNGTTYSIKLRAVNNVGDGIESSAVSVIPIVSIINIWTQMGDDINGEAAFDNSGYSVSLSADGSIVAIGALYNDGNGSNSGHVRVYKNINGVWTKVGEDINGEAAADNSGSSVSLSADGSTVAIGAIYNDGNGVDSGHVRVYKNINSVWTQIGQDINGEAAYDNSGNSVSLSADGSTVAIGAPGNGTTNKGHVRVYKYSGTQWNKLGQDIDGEAADDYSGISVSLSADGSTVAIGASGNDGNGVDSGHVRVYNYNGSVWAKQGQDIDGEAEYHYSGSSVSLSADGSTVAIKYNSEYIKMYKNINNVWTQVGQSIYGGVSSLSLNTHVNSLSLNANGTTIAIGTNRNDTDSGYVRVYKNINNVWTQVGDDINGEAAGDQSGISVSLNADGSIVAIGALNNDGNGTNSGHVRVYKYE
jgi:hypothetical protein